MRKLSRPERSDEPGSRSYKRWQIKVAYGPRICARFAGLSGEVANAASSSANGG